jgi:hypothetical protein
MRFTPKLKKLGVLSLAVFVLAPMAYSATIATITLNESQFEKFGSLFFVFRFRVPQTFYLCEIALDHSQPTGCLRNAISDLITVTNNQFGEGVVSVLSDAVEGVLVVPPNFPLPPPGSPHTALFETGRPQILTSPAGLATVLPTGAPGPPVSLTVTSDLNVLPPQPTSDVLAVGIVGI